MDLYLLEYLVAFRDCGTVEAAAARLSVTAPTISRGLKKLEGQLGVSLLDRTPARMSLNATGLFAAGQAEALLARADGFAESVRRYDAGHNALRAASAVPGVLRLLDGFPSAITCRKTFVNSSEAAALLQSYQADLVITTTEHEGDGLESVFLGRDSLIVKLTDINALHGRTSLSFADLAGQEFVLPRCIGAWKDVIERNAQDVMLIYQDDDAAFQELVRYSNFPIFRTLLTQEPSDDGFRARRSIPLADAAATLELYATYRAGERARLADAVRFLSNALSEALEKASTDLAQTSADR